MVKEKTKTRRCTPKKKDIIEQTYQPGMSVFIIPDTGGFPEKTKLLTPFPNSASSLLFSAPPLFPKLRKDWRFFSEKPFQPF